MFDTMSVTLKLESPPFKAFYCKLVTTGTGKGAKFTKAILLIYYDFGLSLDTRDLKMYVSRPKRTRCHAKIATFVRPNF